MRRVRLFIASSLDCYIARKDGGVDWCFTDADYGYAEFYDSVDAVIMGRKTYEKALEFEERPYKEKKCYVFTRKPAQNHDNVEFVSDVAGFTKNLVGSDGRDIWLAGGAEINSILLGAGLVHEMIVSVHPLVLGEGIPMFREIRQANMKLAEVTKYDSGLVQLCYKLPC